METAQPGPAALAEWIIEQISDAIIYANREGVIERWNAAATAVFGFAASAALGRSLDLIIPEHLRAAHWQGFDAAIASGATRLHGRPTLTRALHQSGRTIYVEMSFSLVADAAGTILGSVSMARDVSERVERDKAARRSAAGG